MSLADEGVLNLIALLQRQLRVSIRLPTGETPQIKTEPLPFYKSRHWKSAGARVFLGRLFLPAGSSIGAKGAPQTSIGEPEGRTYVFLLEQGAKGNLDGARVYRLSSNVYDLTEANRHLSLDIDEENGPKYVQFYGEFGEINEPALDRRKDGPRLTVPVDIRELVFDRAPGSEDDRNRVEGALWHVCEIEGADPTVRSSRLTAHLRSTVEFLRTPLIGWVPAQQANSLVEVKVRVGRFTGNVDAIRVHQHFFSTHLLAPERKEYDRWPVPKRPFRDAATWLGRGLKRLLAYTGVLAGMACALVTLVTPLLGLWPDVALGRWFAILGLGSGQIGSWVVLTCSATTLVALTFYNLLWSDLRSIASFCRKLERLQRVGPVKAFVRLVRWHDIQLRRTNTLGKRIRGAIIRGALLTFLAVFGFTSLQLAYDANPYGARAGSANSGQIVVNSWIDPVHHTASFSTMSILLEDIYMQVPGVLSLRGIRPQPIGKDGLPTWLRLSFALVSAFVVIRGVFRYWGATSPDEAFPARSPRARASRRRARVATAKRSS